MKSRRVLLSWSGGKDSAWALHVLRRGGARVEGLLTTVAESTRRVSVHGVREALLEAQARSAGVPLRRVELPDPCPNEIYEARMRSALADARREGFGAAAHGDLFLEDIRAYRETLLQGTGLEPLFPLWKRETRALAREMVAAGLRARIVCIDLRAVPRSFAGRDFDAALLRDLPDGVDPCAENGEFHTFCHTGPMLSQAIPVRTGPTHERNGFLYTDLA